MKNNCGTKLPKNEQILPNGDSINLMFTMFYKYSHQKLSCSTHCCDFANVLTLYGKKK